MSRPKSRRAFLKHVAGAALGAVCAPAIIRAQSLRDRVRLAFIGTMGMGETHVRIFSEMGAECPCFCDVDTRRWGEAARRFPKARRYQDYRRMLEKEAANVDAVAIAVPDHHHYPATILAMKAGKAVYTQKPLAHTVWEARQLTLAAEKHKVATQMGNQGHANSTWRLACEWIAAGAIGEVKEVHTWTDRPIWPQGIPRPQGHDPVPANLNWDCWIGPAPMRDYKGNRTYHDFNWRGFWDFGAGTLGDMAPHTMDGLFFAMQPACPVAIEVVSASGPTEDTFPRRCIIKWEFSRTEKNPAFAAWWYDGNHQPAHPIHLERDRKLPPTGELFVGTKASILFSGDYGDTVRIIPDSVMRQVGVPPQTIERAPAGGNYREFLDAAAGLKPLDYCKSRFAYSGPMSEAILLGNVALKVGKRIEWDSRNLRITNIPEASRYITKEYRKGWDFTI